MTFLVTGAAGFIGYHVALRLIESGRAVIGVDNLNSYYDIELKSARLSRLQSHPLFRFHRGDVSDRSFMTWLTQAHQEIEVVIHLAAQAGVRYSLIDPYAYVTANVMGQVVVLEAARTLPILKHLVYASSSSVYGAGAKMPLSPEDAADQPISLYAATKRADELIGHTYAHLYGLPLTGLRFFTVYGPWGRPDMAPMIFTHQILAGEPISVFNHGRQKRDFTYIDDIVDGVLAAAEHPPGTTPPHAIYNLGNGRPEGLMEFIAVLEEAIGRKAVINFQPPQPGDVTETYADISRSIADLGYLPRTSIREGLPRVVEWYREFYRL